MDYFISISVFFVLVLVLWALGRKLLGAAGLKTISVSENMVFSFAMGFGTLSCVILFLGILRILYPLVTAGVIMAIAILVLPEIRMCLRDIPVAFSVMSKAGREAFTGFFLCLLLTGMAVTMVGAMAPSFSNDSMVYHLTDAKYFAGAGTVGLIPFNSTNCLWPYLVEMYYTMALVLGLFPLTGLFHFSLAVFSAAAVYAFSKRFFSVKTGVFASTIFFLTPAVFSEATHTYVDLGSVLYAFLAFYAFVLYQENKDFRWALFSGVMCGFGLSVKYFFAVVPIILLVCFFAAAFFKKPTELKMEGKAILSFMLAAALFSSVWYLRQYVVRGTPLFPFFSDIFGGGGLDNEVLKLVSERSIRVSHGMSTGLGSFLSLPWRTAMRPEEFGGERLGALFLALIPGLLLTGKLTRILKYVMGFSLLYTLFWFFQYQHMRFFLPAIPFLSVLSAWVLASEWNSRTLKRLLMFTVSAFLVIHLSLNIYRNIDRGKVVFGITSEEDYLSDNERSFDVSMYINGITDENVKIMVVNESNTFFIDKPYRREIYWWIFDRYDKYLGGGAEVINKLKSEGFSHILYADYENKTPEFQDRRRLTGLIRDSGFREDFLELVYRNKPVSGNARGVEYSIYRIK